MFSQQHRLLQVVSPLPQDACIATSLNGSEYISATYRYRIGLQSSTRITADALLGRELALKQRRDDAYRWFRGVVCEWRELGKTHNACWQYQVEVVPAMALLELSSHNRIFENLSVIDIVSSVLQASGQKVDASRIKSSNRRECCTQFSEDDLAFVHRVLAEEGIAYYFRQNESECVCVLVDDSVGFDRLSERVEAFSGAMPGGVRQRDEITNLQLFSRLRPSTLTSCDWSEYESTPLTTTSRSQSSPLQAANLGVESHGQHYFVRHTSAVREMPYHLRQSQVRKWLQGLTQDCTGVQGHSMRVDFHAGLVVHMVNAQDDFDQHYLLTAVHHSIADGNDQPTVCSNHFVAVPQAQGFVPHLSATRARMHGVFCAKVTEIKPPAAGAHAEVRVAFAWHASQSSCWARVAQREAGDGWGEYFVPAPGQEVLVAFINGDADRPVVVGALYNRDHPLPPFTATQSGLRTQGGKFNELRFDSRAGAEEFYMEAGRDHNYVVRNNQTGVITCNRETTISQGDDITRVCAGNKIVDVAQQLKLQAECGITLQVGGSTLCLDASGVRLNGTLISVAANAQVDVSGGAVANISGGVVNIN